MSERMPSFTGVRLRATAPRIGGDLDDPVLSGHFSEPSGAQLGDAGLGLVIGPDDPEPLGESLGPLPVVHQGPEEISPDVVPFRDRSVDADQVVADVLATVEVDDLALGSDLVVERRAILGDVERLDPENFACKPHAPIQNLGRHAEPGQIAVGERAGAREKLPTTIGTGTAGV